MEGRTKEIEIGLVASTLGHALIALLILRGYILNPNDFGKPIIYSVTMEGGQSLGGIGQVPDDSKKTQVAPPKKIDTQAEEIKKAEIEKAEISLREEKKKQEEKKKEEKLKTDEEKKKKEEEEKKKKEDEKKKEAKKKETEGTDVNKKLQQAMQRYLGESTEAGGKGFGAGAIGGKGMGGGQVMPEAFHRYKKLLQTSIKSGWRWYDSSAVLLAEAIFDISPEGDISNVRISKRSGNAEFDDSVERAILKASPLPPPPPEVYDPYFKSVRMTFDPKDL
jgi:colicin import membrane protein